MKIFEGREGFGQLARVAELSRPVYYCGLDLGQAADYSAFSILERSGTNLEDYKYDCRFLHRWKHRTGYPEIVSDALKWTNNPTLVEDVRHPTVLAVDQTGVGAGVVDLFRLAPMRSKLVPITITAGSTVTRDGDSYKVPKRDLVGAVAVALQTGKLKISQELPLAPTLKSELENFKAKITPAGNDTYGAGEDWRVGNNDDLVLSLSMALWCAMNGIKPAQFFSC